MHRRLAVALLASAALLATPALAAEYRFEKVATIYLPTENGHGDIVTYDSSNGMVYVSLKGDGLAVIDTRTNTVVHTIKDIPQPNGNDWDADHVYVAAAEGAPQGMNGGNNGTGFGHVTNEIVVVSKRSWTVVGRVRTQGTTPDWVGVDRQHGMLYVDSDDRNFMEAYSTGDHPQLKGVWHLYPLNINHWWMDTADYTGPDVAWIGRNGREIYQSVDQYVEVVDTSTGNITRHGDTGVELTKKGGTKGEWLDEKNNRLWVASTSKKPGLLVLNPETLQVIKAIPQTGGVDQLVADPGLGLIYTFVSSPGGFDVTDANTMEHVAWVPTGVKTTHTGDVDTATHNVYVYEGDRASVGVYKPVRQ